MNTLRSRLPVLISECISKGIVIEFKRNEFNGKPELLYKYPRLKINCSVFLLDFEDGFHGANTLIISEHLSHALEDYDKALKGEY